MVLLPVFVPILWGLFLLIRPEFQQRKYLLLWTGAGLFLSAVFGLFVTVQEEAELFLWSFGTNLDLYFRVDDLGRLFAVVMILVWTLSGLFAMDYMKHEKEEKRI